jgi:hypothetical protein
VNDASTGTPRTRDRAATEERILGAGHRARARRLGIGINDRARARIDKVLIYRYFGGLPELLRAWGASGRFWPSIDELLGDEPRRVLELPEANAGRRSSATSSTACVRDDHDRAAGVGDRRTQRTDGDPGDRTRAMGRAGGAVLGRPSLAARPH